MACPTCDHTMQCVSHRDDLQTYHCPRCGTVKVEDANDDNPLVYVPKLVGRVIEFAGKLTDEHQELIAEFERIGIREAICLEG